MPDETEPTSSDATKSIGEETMRRMFAADASAAGSVGRVAEGGMEQPGVVVGRYRLIEKLGEGGFGAVWRAEQSEPIKREVALKLIKAGMDSAEIIARFEAERQALALMEHPNIAGVLDAGTTENGRPFFVMELVRGEPITRFADSRKLTIRERLELFIPVCQAVQHAHQKAILHRDLKPGNILVSEVDGKPVPKVIDFGIAKALGGKKEDAQQAALTLTHTGSFIGTPRYMSPEQAGAKADLDTRSDIYTLGVILFELLTGDTPLSAETLGSAAFDEMLRMIREIEVPKPSSRVGNASDETRTAATTRGTEPGKLTRTLRGDLDWISLRALEKDRERRYGSAAALAADIARHLASEPVEAGPPSALYRFRKFAKRNRLALAASSAIILSLIAGIVASSLQAARASKAEQLATARLRQVSEERKRADSERDIANLVNEFLRNDILAQAGSNRQADGQAKFNPHITVREALDRASKKIGSRFIHSPHIEAALRLTLGQTFMDLGNADAAVQHLSRAVELHTQVWGAEHPLTLGSRSSLGFALGAQGRHDEAEAAHRAVLAIHQRVFGAEHPATLSSRANLAVALRLQKKYAEAERECRTVLSIRERVQGVEHTSTLSHRIALADLLNDQGRHAEAEAEIRAVLAIQERTLGAENPATLASRSRLAGVLHDQKKDAEAEQERRAVMAIRERVMGAEHPASVVDTVQLANVLNAQGKQAEAEQHFRATVASYARERGAEHRDTLRARMNLGNGLHVNGKHAAAEQEHLAVLAIQRRVLGDEDPDTLISRDNLANALQSLGKHAEAERERRAVLGARERALGKEHSLTVMSRYLFAESLRIQGKASEAEKEYRAVLAVQEQIPDARNPEVSSVRKRLGSALAAQKKYDETEREYRAVLPVYERGQGLAGEDAMLLRNDLASVLEQMGKTTEALGVLLEACEMRQKALGTTHSATVKVMRILAHKYEKQGQIAEHFRWVEEVAKADPADSIAALNTAAYLLWMGQGDQFEKWSGGIVARALASGDSATRERAAKPVLAVASASEALVKDAIRLAELAMAGADKGPFLPWFRQTSGIAHYRQGRYAEAEPIFVQTRSQSPSLTIKATCLAYEAMCLHHLGRKDDAAKRLAAASVLFPTVPKRGTLTPGLFNNENVVLWLAIDEAAALLSAGK